MGLAVQPGLQPFAAQCFGLKPAGHSCPLIVCPVCTNPHECPWDWPVSAMLHPHACTHQRRARESRGHCLRTEAHARDRCCQQQRSRTATLPLSAAESRSEPQHAWRHQDAVLLTHAHCVRAACGPPEPQPQAGPQVGPQPQPQPQATCRQGPSRAHTERTASALRAAARAWVSTMAVV